MDRDTEIAVIEQYVDERGLKLDPWDALEQCYTESMAFLEVLANHGVKASAVSGLKFEGGLVAHGHWAVRIGDDVWDWTYRQFDPECDVPRVTTWDQWNEEWSHIGEGADVIFGARS